MNGASHALKRLNCKDLTSYLKTLPPYVLEKLYKNPATCLAVFRNLPDVARHYVMRLLFVESPVSQDVIKHWVVKGEIERHEQAVEALRELQVWEDSPIPGGLPGWKLKTTFRQNFKVVMLGGGNSWTRGSALEPDKHTKDIESLEKYAIDRWECVLNFLVGSPSSREMLTDDIINLIEYSGLMTVSDHNHYITPAGFQFLLMDTPSQVWFLILQYLNTAEERKMNLVETLTFLFEISFANLGKEYSVERLTEGQSRFLQHLRELGLIHQRKRKSGRFYPTKLAIDLANGCSNTVPENINGFIVAETNYKIYAYTNSPLHTALLALFSDILCRFPGLVVANLTRDSVRNALVHGITAHQIINYLKSYAHPQMAKEKPVLPPTITDQIRIWELERDRISYNEGVLYNQFLSQSDFEILRDHAKERGVLIWSNPATRMMVVALDGHDDVRKFWKKRKQVKH